MRIRTGVALAASVALAAAANASRRHLHRHSPGRPRPGSLRLGLLAARGGQGRKRGLWAATRSPFPAGRFRLRIAGAGEDAAATGDLDLTKSVTIAGLRARATLIDGSAEVDRVFDITSGVTALISDVTVTGGLVDGNGGGIASAGMLTLATRHVAGNQATTARPRTRDGGGIDSSGTLTLTETEVSGNGAYNGGGISRSPAPHADEQHGRGNTAGGPGSNGDGGGISGSGGATLTLDRHHDRRQHAFNGLGSGGGITSPTATLGGTIVANNLAHETNQSATYADNCSVGTIATQAAATSRTRPTATWPRPSDRQDAVPCLARLPTTAARPTPTRCLAGSPAIDAGARAPRRPARGDPAAPVCPARSAPYEVAPPTPGGSPATSVHGRRARCLRGRDHGEQRRLTAYRFAWTVEGDRHGRHHGFVLLGAERLAAHLRLRLTGLQPGTTYSYALVGVNADGTGSSTPRASRPTRIARSRCSASFASRPGSFARPRERRSRSRFRRPRPRRCRFDRVLPGRAAGQRCVAANRPNRRGRACTRYVPVVGSVAVRRQPRRKQSPASTPRSPERPLRPSAYRLSAQLSKDGSGNVGKTVITAFRVRR